MSFEIKSAAQQGPGESPAETFPDDEWRNLIALARECGFGPDGEYERLVYLDAGASFELDARAAQRLYIGVGAVLNQDTLPFAATWDEEDARLHFRWVEGPRAGSRFSLDKARLRRLADQLYKGPMLVSRVPDPKT